ncbi:hypothetical protein [Cecembia rubra]|uniref:Outer membrane protein with beta-barrel domain n=1 Tax=Cecembia rubra TaxID=1485585 RepID=A0A2P8EDI4_9BACT|nr:hypothetical protein [Cecembia rubra]PSL07518.1 hypothetical protein CLV48_101450 [Cecembia rubra]
MIKRFMFLTYFLMGLSYFSFGQRYATSLGLRMGSNDYSRTIGFTGKQRIMSHLTLEGILQTDFDRNTTGHLLMARHRPIISKRLNYYYGGGLSAGWEESYVKDKETKEIIHTYGNSTMGLDIIGGLELTVANTVFSLDYKPNVNFAGREEFFRGQVGISARTVLVKSKEQDKKWRKKRRAKRKKNNETFGDKFKNTFQFNNR